MKTKKLSLRVETLQALTPDSLDGVHGGIISGDNPWPPPRPPRPPIGSCFCLPAPAEKKGPLP